MTNEIVLFNDGNVNIEVQINPEQETVWLTQKQIETLFGVSHATVSEHISNILKSGELDDTSVEMCIRDRLAVACFVAGKKGKFRKLG